MQPIRTDEQIADEQFPRLSQRGFLQSAAHAEPRATAPSEPPAAPAQPVLLNINALPWSSKSLRECYRVNAERFGWSRRTAEPRSMREGRTLVGVKNGDGDLPCKSAGGKGVGQHLAMEQ